MSGARHLAVASGLFLSSFSGCSEQTLALEPLPKNRIQGSESAVLKRVDGELSQEMMREAFPSWEQDSIFSPDQQNTTQILGRLPTYCPLFVGAYPHETVRHEGPILSLFTEPIQHSDSMQLSFALNDSWSLPDATRDQYSCTEVTEGTMAYQLDFKPTTQTPEAFFFMHTVRWRPLNARHTRSLAFDVKTAIPLTIYMESRDEHGELLHAEVPLERYAPSDGRWHSVEIPMADFEGLKTDRIVIPFGITATQEGTVYLDHGRLTDYRVNEPPGVGYSPHIELSEGQTSHTLQVMAADADGDALTWSVFSPPSNGALALSPDPSGVEVTYNLTRNGPQDAFELKVEDGQGHFLLLPFAVHSAAAPPQPIAVFSEQRDGYYAPILERAHWNGSSALVPSDRPGAAEGDMMLQGGYGNGALIFQPKYDIPLDVSHNHTLKMDLWWAPAGDAPPAFKIIFESEGRSREGSLRRNEFLLSAPAQTWTPIEIDISHRFWNDTDKTEISKIMVYVWNSADIKIDDLLLEVQ